MASDNSRQKLRPWLEAKINSGSIYGLEWIDKKKMIFRIPWKHGGKHDWSKENGEIFKAWAVQTGKYREGIDPEDFPTWKTRLRCAFTKSKEIQEIKTRNNLDDSLDPYKVYQFVTKSHESGAKRSYSPEIKPGVNNGLLGPGLQPMEYNHHQQGVTPQFIPQPVESMTKSSSLSSGSSGGMSGLGSGMSFRSGSMGVGSGNLGSDLENIPSDDLLKPIPKRKTVSPTFGQQGSPAGSVMVEDTLMMDVDYPAGQAEACQVPVSAPQYTNTQPMLTTEVQQNMEQPKDNEFVVKLFYRVTAQAEYNITNENGCRLYYGDTNLQPTPSNGNMMPPELFGPSGPEQISFPVSENCIRDRKQLEYTNKLLSCMDRGLLLECIKGDIYATRLCRCMVFYSTMFCNNGLPVKLIRNERTKIFEQATFVQELGKYLQSAGNAPVPDTEIRLAFGQKLSVTDKLDMTMIIATVNHSLSQYIKQHYMYNGIQDHPNTIDCRSIPVYISENDHVDKIVELIKESIMV